MKKAISITIGIIVIVILSVSLFMVDASAASIPTQYNNNINDPMYVTSVKNQEEYGVCWAFSAISCCESELIKNHGADKDTLDLSELHLAYFAYNAERPGTGDSISPKLPFYEIGADVSFPVFALSNWIGLVSEDTASFDDFLNDPQMTLDSSLAYETPEYYIKNAYMYDYTTDVTLIKQAIMDFGAIQTSYFADDSFLNNSTAAYYCPNAYTMNHGVSIIGWDDNYSKTNFKSSARPSKNGAWLAKNSWGEENGNGGFFWISYEDKSIKQAIAYDVEPASEFNANKNYQHDGGFALVYYEYQNIKAANVFKATSNESLTAISVFTHKANNTPYTLKIYKNPKNLSPSTFTSGSPIYQQSGVIPYAGYATLELSSPVSLSKDDTFIVYIETSAILGVDCDEQITNGSQVTAEAITTAQANQSYASFDGSKFYDLSTTEDGLTPSNIRIKAFTKDLSSRIDPQVMAYPTMESIDYGMTLKESSLVGGKVIDPNTGTVVSGTWSFDDENSVVEGTDYIEITFTPDDSQYNSASATILAEVIPVYPNIEISLDKDSYISGKPITLTVNIKNPHNENLSDFGEISYYYLVDDGEYINFGGPVFNVKNLKGENLRIMVMVNDVEGKYYLTYDMVNISIDSNPLQPEDPLETEESYTDAFETEESDTDEFGEESDVPTDSEGWTPDDVFTDTSVTDNMTDDNIFDETDVPDRDDITEGTAEEDTLSTETYDSINEFITDEIVNDPTQTIVTEQDTSTITDTATATEEETTKSIEDELAEIFAEELFGCGSSISISALATVLAFSAIAITKKRKH